MSPRALDVGLSVKWDLDIRWSDVQSPKRPWRDESLQFVQMEW